MTQDDQKQWPLWRRCLNPFIDIALCVIAIPVMLMFLTFIAFIWPFLDSDEDG